VGIVRLGAVCLGESRPHHRDQVVAVEQPVSGMETDRLHIGILEDGLLHLPVPQVG